MHMLRSEQQSCEDACERDSAVLHQQVKQMQAACKLAVAAMKLPNLDDTDMCDLTEKKVPAPADELSMPLSWAMSDTPVQKQCTQHHLLELRGRVSCLAVCYVMMCEAVHQQP